MSRLDPPPRAVAQADEDEQGRLGEPAELGAGMGNVVVVAEKPELVPVNAAYDLTYDPQTKNVVKSDALLIRGKSEGELNANRFSHAKFSAIRRWLASYCC